MMETQISDNISLTRFLHLPSAREKLCDACVPGAGSWVNIAAAVVEQDYG